MEASLGLLEVELVKLRRQLLVFVKEEAGEELWDAVPVSVRKFVDDFLKDAQVGVVRALDEAVKKDDHLVELEGVADHDLQKVFKSVLKEEKFGALGVRIEQLVGNDR